MRSYPRIRMRRNRKASWSRELLAETHLSPSDLIMPLFVIDGINKMEEIAMMPGVFRYTIDKVVEKVKSLYDMGIQAVMLFPYIENGLKNIRGDEALNKRNLISRTIREIKRYVPQIGVIADVALDPYTSHGHDGVLDKNDDVDNDETIKLLVEQSLILADAGADALAPSDMMDGRIGVIRDSLESNGYKQTQLFAYSVKFNSCLYKPFRAAVGSEKNLGQKDKSSYFIDYRNSKEALAEISLDVSEGADAIIIKPAMMYLDIISSAAVKFPNVPIFAYQVSGEYLMLTSISDYGMISEQTVVREAIYALKRAGAKCIVTYYADRLPFWENY